MSWGEVYVLFFDKQWVMLWSFAVQTVFATFFGGGEPFLCWGNTAQREG